MKSIRGQLVALLLAVVLPLLVLEGWNAFRNYRQLVEQAEMEVLELAKGTAAATAEVLSLSEQGMASVARYLAADGPGLPDQGRCADVLEAAAASLPHLRGLSVLAPGGRVVCSAEEEALAPADVLARHGWFRTAFEEGRFVIGEPGAGPLVGAWVVTLAQPLPAEGAVEAVLIGSIELDSFQELFPPEMEVPEEALLTITDADLRVVARSRELDRWVGRHLGTLTDRERQVGPGQAIVRSADLQGVPRTFARVDLATTGWHVYAGLPDRLIYAPARARAVREGMVTVLIVVLAVLLAVGFYRRIAGALRSLVQGVRDAAREGEHHLPREGPEEVQAVASALSRTLRDRSRAEEAERRAKERYRSILENAVFGIYLSTPRGDLLEVNPALCQLLGYESPEALQAAGVEAIYPDPRLRERLVREYLETGEPIRDMELEWLRKDGTPVIVRLNGKIIEGTAREPLFEVIVEDITAQKALEKEYRHTQKMEAIGRLAGGVAHDFNNVLTAILGHAMLLTSRMPEDAAARADAEEIIASARRASTLTRQLLAFSRKEVTQPRPLDLSALVQDLERMLRRVIGEDVEMVTELEPALPLVEADPGQMEQVLLNLILNARDALPGGGRITVRTSIEGEVGDGDERRWVVLEVEDTGTGMDPQVQDRIFDPFFTTKGPGEGTGLGLSTVYGMVTKHDGSISVRSETGRGSCFRIRLPTTDRPLPASDEDGLPNDPAAARGRILLVEDEESLRSVVRRVLQRSGYSVTVASDGAEALRMLTASGEAPDLLLTDVVMPGIGGLETADRVQELFPGTRVLFVSGYTESEALRIRTREDPDVFLPKPFTPDELLERVRTVLRRELAPGAAAS